LHGFTFLSADLEVQVSLLEGDEALEEEDQEEESKHLIKRVQPKKSAETKAEAEEDVQNHGAVSLAVYGRYFSAGNSAFGLTFLVAINIFTHGLFFASDLLIGYWYSL